MTKSEEAEATVQRYALKTWDEPLRVGPRRENLLRALLRLPEIVKAEPLAFMAPTVGEILARAATYVRTDSVIQGGSEMQASDGRRVEIRARTRREGEAVMVPHEVTRALCAMPPTPEPSSRFQDGGAVGVLTSRPEALPASLQGAALLDAFGVKLRDGLRAVGAFFDDPSPSLSRPVDELLGEAKAESFETGAGLLDVQEALAEKVGTTRDALLKARQMVKGRRYKRAREKKDTLTPPK